MVLKMEHGNLKLPEFQTFKLVLKVVPSYLLTVISDYSHPNSSSWKSSELRTENFVNSLSEKGTMGLLNRC